MGWAELGWVWLVILLVVAFKQHYCRDRLARSTESTTEAPPNKTNTQKNNNSMRRACLKQLALSLSNFKNQEFNPKPPTAPKKHTIRRLQSPPTHGARSFPMRFRSSTVMATCSFSASSRRNIQPKDLSRESSVHLQGHSGSEDPDPLHQLVKIAHT